MNKVWLLLVEDFAFDPQLSVTCVCRTKEGAVKLGVEWFEDYYPNELPMPLDEIAAVLREEEFFFSTEDGIRVNIMETYIREEDNHA